MGLYYPEQTAIPLIGTKSGTTRTPSTLTTAYTGNTSNKLPVTGMSKVTFYVNYISTAASNKLTLRVRTSPKGDGTNMYQTVNESASAGLSTLSLRAFEFTRATAADPFVLPLDIFDGFVEIAALETLDSGTHGTVYIEAMMSGR